MNLRSFSTICNAQTMHGNKKLYAKNELFSECVKFLSENSCLQHCCENLKSRKFISVDTQRECRMIFLSVTPLARRSCNPFTVHSTQCFYCMKLVFWENALWVTKLNNVIWIRSDSFFCAVRFFSELTSMHFIPISCKQMFKEILELTLPINFNSTIVILYQ